MLPAARQHVLLAAGWEGSERFLGAGGTSVPELRPGHAAALRTGYTVPDARIPCGEPLPSACACLAPSCQCSGLFQQQVGHLWACVRACVPGGRQCPDISLPHITVSNVGTPPTADMVRPAAPPQLPCPMAIADARRHPCPGDRASALPCALPPSASLCSSREIIAPKLHGVASTILLIRVGVC